MEKNVNKNIESKQLPEVFKELQAIRNKAVRENIKECNENLTSDIKNYNFDIQNNVRIDINNFKQINILKNIYLQIKKIISFGKNKKINRYICRIAEDLKIRKIKLHQISVALSMLTIATIVVSLTTNSLFAKEENKIDEKQAMIVEFEQNENAIDLLEVLSDNISVTTRKDIIAEESDITYSIKYIENDKMPKGEENVIEAGKNGRKETTYIRTYENDEMISEEIVGLLVLEEPQKETVEIGTSEYLGKHNVHIGEKMFLTQDTELKEEKSNNSNSLTSIWIYMDVILLDFDEKWCKVMYNDKVGYISNDLLVTETTMPGVEEISRKQRILSKVEFNMDISIPTNMTKEDFKKVLTDSSDKKKIFENSSEVFYNMEQKYGINGIFLASVGIHESAWGTSKIATSKNNLFGYMAYDRNPYAFSANFESYESGIETLARVFCKYYLYPAGTPIYEEEVAKGSYYNGANVAGVNVRYASDKEWCNKVYKTMVYLYSKLP